MSLDELYIPDSPESGKNSTEVSEKYKQAVKKASAGIRRTQKDEDRQKKYDFLLAKFLVELILKRKYDSLLEILFRSLDAGYGSNFLLGILSLVYLPISHEIRKFSGKPEIRFSFSFSQEKIPFSSSHLPEEIRVRVNQWLEDIQDVLQLESSAVITKRNMRLLVYDESIRNFTTEVFTFFFEELHFDIQQQTSVNYAEFILGELEKNIKNFYEKMRQDWESEGLEI